MTSLAEESWVFVTGPATLHNRFETTLIDVYEEGGLAFVIMLSL